MQKTTHLESLPEELLNDLNRSGLAYSSDKITRLLYSTDASIYQMMPLGVVWPKNTSEVSAVVEIAGKYHVPVLPRGGGSSLAGQAIGKALILDFSRHMDQILALNPENNTVVVQPGAILGGLNRQLAAHQLMFGPDPASADRATLGGVLGNNASGAHSILYGMAHDHLLAAETILSDGSIVTFMGQDSASLAVHQKKKSLEGSIYQELPKILDRYSTEIKNNYPKTFRNVAGYNLNILAGQAEINPASLLVGSEGTLGIITAATLNLVQLPSHSTLYLVHFPDLGDALACVPEILETNPSAVELIDRMLIELARANPAYQPLLSAIQGNPEAVLAVEYQGDDLRALSGKETLLNTFGPTVPLMDPKDQAKIWKARIVGLGILQSKRGDAKPITFIEDAAVPVKHLASYALEIKRFAKEIGVGAIAFYAHASAGCLHIRPQVNLKNQAGLKQMRLLAEKSLELVLKFGGTTSGEHGEGFARGEFTKKLYGPELINAFQEVKEVFDPEYLLNPGKIINPPAMDQKDLLRYGPDYQAVYKPTQTLLNFETDLGFDRAVEMCNGAGVCRQLDGGVMCPSFQATRDEGHSTRGRANMLRAAMTGKLGPNGMTSKELYQTLDLCLSCQACMTECPSAVDMSKLKAEFLYQYYQAHGLPFRSWFFANIGEISKLAQVFSFLLNPILNSPLARLLSLIGIHPDRQMPAFAKQTFTTWVGKQYFPEPEAEKPRAVFFYDTYLEYNYPHIGQALVKICQKIGVDLIILNEKVDSGRPAFSKGVLNKAQKLARINLKLLAPYAEKGIPIIGCEPSVMVMLKKEYRDLVPGPEAEAVSNSAMMAEDFLVSEIKTGRVNLIFDQIPRSILFHGHCQQKANFGTGSTLELLRSIPNSSVEQIEAGCCGMAGAFGYEKEHYSLSLEIAELGLAPRVREADLNTIICASGTSCREQIAHTTERDAVHPLEIFSAALA
ncbi:MAG: FAD-binding protein [Anaerolineales bacterium]|nr:FAD-binding protein [Anaerolineales bacterium]